MAGDGCLGGGRWETMLVRDDMGVEEEGGKADLEKGRSN